MTANHSTTATRPGMRNAAAFSLVELLLAIFIMGIGVISIASLFPVGIAQQRRSGDDTVGPMVAANAVSVLRNKLSQADFGVFEEFSGASSPRVTVQGDWSWLRPAFIFPDGAIDIFNGSGNTGADENSAGGSSIASGLPFNTTRYPSGAPEIIFTQGERAYPMYSGAASSLVAAQSQYYWDCMFRRYQGRVYVAVFVYRVTNPPGDRSPYVVQENPSPNDSTPPLPIWLQLATSSSPVTAWDASGPDLDIDTRADNAIIIGNAGGTAYDPTDATQAWQEPGQWILDPNNNIHRVLGQFRNSPSDALQVELVRPVPRLAPVPINYAVSPAAAIGEDVVSDIWYLPVVDNLGRALSPVYLLVEEL